MFYRKESNQYISEGMPFEIAGTKYAENWLNLSTPEDKTALGLVEVTTTGEVKYSAYYLMTESLEDGIRTIVATPRDLEEVKAEAILKTNKIAADLLLSTDWMVIRSIETSTPMPIKKTEARTAIRIAAHKTVELINKAKTVDDVEAAMAIELSPKT